MANTTIQIGAYVLPATQHYSFNRIPQYAEFISLNGIVWRDRRTTEDTYVVSLGWEALTPTEKATTDLAWEAIINAKPSSFTQFLGVTSYPFSIVPDEKSNDYNYTVYMGAVDNSGFTTLYDASLIFRVIRVYV